MVLALVIALSPFVELDAAREGLAKPVSEWVTKGGPLANSAYVLIVITLIAALVERVVETTISVRRATYREVLEHHVQHADRAWKSDKKNVTWRNQLLNAELHLQAYRAETRLQTLRLSIVLGTLAAAIIDLPLVEVFFGDYLKDYKLARAIEILVIGILIAGGSGPLHDLIASFTKGVRNVATIGSKKIT